MAPMSSQRASSSSTPRCTYDVFVSFCGQDSQKSFPNHLCTAMKQNGINISIDNEKLVKGKDISLGLLSAIQESEFAVIIISENYVFSKRCLKELAKIVELHRGTRLKVLLIFYHVNCLGEQRNNFTEAFARHKEDPETDEEQEKKWRAALREVSDFSGWDLPDRPESIVVEEICGEILGGFGQNSSNISQEMPKIQYCLEMPRHQFDIHKENAFGASAVQPKLLERDVEKPSSSEINTLGKGTASLPDDDDKDLPRDTIINVGEGGLGGGKVGGGGGGQEEEEEGGEGKYWEEEEEGRSRWIAVLYVGLALHIASIAHAALLKPPGGYNDLGIPRLLGNKWFSVFAASNTITFTFSIILMVIFILVFISQYKNRDLPWSRTWERFGFITLFIVMVGMTLSFIAVHFLMYQSKVTWLLIVFGVTFVAIVLSIGISLELSKAILRVVPKKRMLP